MSTDNGKNHCNDHVSIATDVARSCQARTYLEASIGTLTDQVRTLGLKVESLSRRLWLFAGAIAVIAAIATPGVKLLWERLIPTANAQTLSMEAEAGLVEAEQVERLLDAAESGHWGVVIGLVMIVIVTLSRGLSRDLLSAKAEKLVSALTAVVSAVAVLLAASVSPSKAVLLGLLASPASAGFLDALRSLLPVQRRLASDDKPTG